MVECLGYSGTATIELMLPHKRATLTDLTGRQLSELSKSEIYKIDVTAQQIVTAHFKTATTLPEAEVVTEGGRFVPEQKLPALRKYSPALVGHSPFGNESNSF